MVNRVRIEDLLKENFLEYFDFSTAPVFVKSDLRGLMKSAALSPDYLKRWKRAQRSFIRWTQNKGTFTREYVKRGNEIYDSFFKERGFLSGNVLDIGGGWGLYREWWKRKDTDNFIVHDPGTERYLKGPTKFHQECYQRAFALPMTFLEGLGEVLPYKDNIFDVCIIASTLDHCMDPQKVLHEAYRCLKPGGKILVVQSFAVEIPGSEEEGVGEKKITGLLKRFQDPVTFLKIPKYILKIPGSIFVKLYNVDHHLYSFTDDDETRDLLEKAGFLDITSEVLSRSFYKDQKICVFEGKR